MYPTILLADDDPNDVFLLTRAFKRIQLLNPVRVVEDARSVIAYFSATGLYANREKYPLPGIMFLDLYLCAIPAVELLPWLRKNVTVESCRIFCVDGQRR